MKWLKWIMTVLECLTIIGPLLKIPKLEKAVEVMSSGVESYSKDPGNAVEGKRIKALIQRVAEKAGIEDYLHKKIKKFTKRQWNKLF